MPGKTLSLKGFKLLKSRSMLENEDAINHLGPLGEPPASTLRTRINDKATLLKKEDDSRKIPFNKKAIEPGDRSCQFSRGLGRYWALLNQEGKMCELSVSEERQRVSAWRKENQRIDLSRLVDFNMICR